MRDTVFRLEDIVQQLLYRYDLVIIPYFGAIIGRKRSAQYNKELNLFSPPYKDISFNPALKESDGLLINYISKTQEISHEKAKEWIKNEVEKWNRELFENKRLILENIGIFTKTDDKIIFQALLGKNFLPESYGLKSFIKLKPMEFNENMDQEQYNPDQKFEELFNSTQDDSKKNYLKYAAILVVGLALFGTGYYFYNHSRDTDSFQKATFVVEKDAEADKTTDASVDESMQTQENEAQAAEQATEQVTEDNEAQNVTDAQSEADENNANETTNNVNEVNENNLNSAGDLSGYKYQIIVGSFSQKENAENKVQSLIDQGYKGQIVGQNSRGLYLVAIDGGETMDEAQEKMRDVINNVEPGAWIHKQQ